MPLSPDLERKFAALSHETGAAAAADFAACAERPWNEKAIAAVAAELLAWIAAPYRKKPKLFAAEFIRRMQLVAWGAFDDSLRSIAMADAETRGLL